jgi:hypothetical protein
MDDLIFKTARLIETDLVPGRAELIAPILKLLVPAGGYSNRTCV